MSQRGADVSGSTPDESLERRRSARSHEAILHATSELLGEAGYSAVTIEAIAARAGVGKATIYRWWGSKGALVIETMGLALPPAPLTETGNLRQDLLAAVRSVVDTFARSPQGAVIPALAADLLSDPEMAEHFRNQVIRPQRSAVVGLLRRAAFRGDLPADVDADLVLDVYAGAVFYRVLISGEPVTDDLAEQLVSLLIDGKPPLTTSTQTKRKPRKRAGRAKTSESPIYPDQASAPPQLMQKPARHITGG